MAEVGFLRPISNSHGLPLQCNDCSGDCSIGSLAQGLLLMQCGVLAWGVGEVMTQSTVWRTAVLSTLLL